MFENGWFGKFYRFGDVVFMLLYINLLWVCFTLIGLVLFGIGPSTVAMFKIFREYWMNEDRDVEVFKTFKQTYKQEFIRANMLTFILLLIPYMIYVNSNFLAIDNETWAAVLHYMQILAMIVYSIMLIYIFPMYVHYHNHLFNYFRNAILVAFYHPLRTIYALAACLTLHYLFFSLPVFLFFFGASLTGFIVTWIVYRTFLRIEYKQDQLQESHSQIIG
ncbi:YesL family protein [Gracilibacillus alcaliphilus]|uniref:YesL family protein n=1 Tax=Gracilibacillus alcaliphilus TaxID=1401441 RepID=UPI00195B037B|nr:DUF624 domain-containing protein [Gracilibacillus alcaliphilus]MBM7677438.1 putative membrane protein YesL [Gracilibacillus alcaliphilus]